MSTLSKTETRCPACGDAFAVRTVDSANVQRMPAFRDALLQGRFMVERCPHCGAGAVVQMDMLLYTDLPRGQFVAVFSPARREEVPHLEGTVAQAFRRAFIDNAPPPVQRSAEHVGQRVVFGYGELREKVVCWDAGLDDRVLEALKLQVMQAQPTLTDLQLDRVEDDVLRFHARQEGEAGELVLQRRQYDGLLALRPTLITLLPALFTGAYVHVDAVLDAAA